MLSLKRSTRGVSKLAFLILLIASATIGAVLSYMWTEAYYIEAGHKVPEGVVIVTITNVTFPIQNATYFNLTVLTPSFSHEDAYITRIALGKNTSASGFETIQVIPPESVEPSIPYPLARSEEVTFRCNQNWGAFAGETVYVAVFLQDGSGSTFPFETGKVRLEVTEVEIDTTVTIERFNLTVRNSDDSIIPLNVTEIMFDSATIPSHNITASSANATFPLQLLPGQAETLICDWNLWKKGGLGSPRTLTAKTAQGYSAIYNTGMIPAAASLNITDVVFALPHTNSFNVTVANQQSSPHFVDIDRITVKNGTQIYENITIEDAPRRISPGNNRTYRCLWNWEAFKECNVEVTVHTAQGFYVEKQVYIQEAYGVPVASFEYSPTPAYTGNVTLNATESYDTYGSIVGYFWDFGDGTNGTGQVIIHNYEENNNYTVSLTVTDNDGLTDIAHMNVTILNRHPIASFSESTETAYTGDYISFNASDSYDPDGTIASYFWDFGDGSNATGIIVSHSYADNGTYTVTLTVTDDDGSTDTTTATKTVLNQPPTASFTESAGTVYTGGVIYFNASASYDSDGIIVSYFWDFGDGANASGVTVDHAYADDGNYTVTLTVTDNDGATDTATATKTILNRPPVAVFTESAETAYVGEPITFNASDSYDSDGIIVSYFWDFGDGTNTTGLVANYAFSSNGTFVVTLTITDDDGATGIINATKTILNPPLSMFLKTSGEIVPSLEGMLQSIGYAHFNLVGHHHSRMELESY